MKKLMKSIIAAAVLGGGSMARADAPQSQRGPVIDLVQAVLRDPETMCVPTSSHPDFDEVCLRYSEDGRVQVHLYRQAQEPVRMAVQVVTGINVSHAMVNWQSGAPSLDGGLFVFALYPSEAACQAVATDCSATMDGQFLGQRITGLLSIDQLFETIAQALAALPTPAAR